jgi:hypothetical protein
VPAAAAPARPLAALGLAVLFLASPRAWAEGSWLSVDAPATATTTSPLSIIEVRGRATPHGAAAHDLVIAIDVSDSTVLPSGWDVDGDGRDGRTDPVLASRLASVPLAAARLADTDLDDSVLAAELTAARALIDRIDLSRDRVALVAFSDRAEVIAPLGSSRVQLVAALDDLPDQLGSWLRGTNFGDAVAVAQLALGPDGVPGRGRQGIVVFLSDGEPTLPPYGDRARQHALWAANAAAAAGVRIDAFALGANAVPGLDVFAALAERSDGRFERLERAGDVIARLRRIDLAGLGSVRIANLTTMRPARAVRTFPDGSFDGYVALEPGRNHLRIEAVSSDGERAEQEREVVFDRSSASPEEIRAHAAALLHELRRRTQETEAWAEMERERRAHSLEVELRLAHPDSP